MVHSCSHLPRMSYEGAIVVEGVNYGHRLPRGRHGIPEAAVIANQRERLLDAATEILAEEGYASLVVQSVIARAGVSRRTFYKIFDNKLDCVVAAQQRSFELLHEAIKAACSSERGLRGSVAAAVAAALEFTGEHPGDARLILATSHALSEPELAREGLDVPERLVGLLRDAARLSGQGQAASSLTERAAVGAAISIVGAQLAADDVAGISDLQEDLVQILLAPYRSRRRG
jgi:AcrR family transcriptional regulator